MSSFDKGTGRRDEGPDEERDGDDRPWSEQRWEKFMKEGEVRSARYGELLETLIDHPDRDEIVAREMGWDDVADELADASTEEWVEDQTKDGDEDWSRSESTPPAAGGEDPFKEGPLDDRDPVESIPAYNLAKEVAGSVYHALKPWFFDRIPEGGGPDPRADDTVELIGEALIGSRQAAAKIAGGHGMGYEDEVLCGNIVKCRQSLEGAINCERALLTLRDRKLVPAEVIEPLLPEVRKVVEAVRQRIEELRARVWW